VPPPADRAGSSQRRTREDLEELLLGATPRYTRIDFAAKAGVALEDARRYWRALGFADLDNDDVVALTDDDLAAFRRIRSLVDSGIIDDDLSLRLTRSFGRMLGRLAEWQVETVLEHLARLSGGGGVSLDTGYAAAETLLPEMRELLDFVWRREVEAAVRRVLAADDDEFEPAGGPDITVGFVDVVGYTRMSRRMQEAELAALVLRFEDVVGDTVAAKRGRLIKTLGDEAMFVVDSPVDGVDIALQLLAATSSDPTLPALRAGLATGPVVARMGDVYGTTVNRASRLTRIAQQGRLVVDGPTARLLSANPGFLLEDLGPHALPGLGAVGVWTVGIAAPARPDPADPLVW
jgi:adenylate cyclase